MPSQNKLTAAQQDETNHLLSRLEPRQAIEMLIAERDRYRKTLERIERVCGWSEGDGDFAVQAAREALDI